MSIKLSDTDQEYLDQLEKDLSETLKCIDDSYKELDSKAKFIAAAFIAFLGSLAGYLLSSYSEFQNWQKLFVAGSTFPLLFCFVNLCSALKGRSLKVSANPPAFSPSITKKGYLIAKVASLKGMIEPNRKQCIEKGSAVNRSFVYLAATVPTAAISATLVFAFDYFYRCLKAGDVNIDYNWLVAAAAPISFGCVWVSWRVVVHFSAFFNGKTKLPDNEPRVEST